MNKIYGKATYRYKLTSTDVKQIMIKFYAFNSILLL